jgi:excisionase family DNA binding protein
MTTQELLAVSDLMKRTKESESAWRKRLSRGELPFVKCGANTRVRLSDFEEWLERRTVVRNTVPDGGRQ